LKLPLQLRSSRRVVPPQKLNRRISAETATPEGEFLSK
jgi:hypothetical protein